MKLDQNEKARSTRNEDEAQSSSRRKFLQKSSAAALVTSLAAQPVWGQSQCSGTMSGGSNTQTDDDPCVIPNVFGRSPGFWTQAMYNGNGNAVISAFTSVDNFDSGKLICYIDEVKANNSYTIPATPDSSEQQVNVATALKYPGSNGGNNWNLAAIWLDARFGFFGNVAPPGRLNTPQEWVEHFFALSVVVDEPFNVVFGGNPTTTWVLPADYSCPS